ncbi:LOG family protein [Geminocystis sp. GBBB08]|uniref:LOG family protein n=1 Tax=Geminocystis sp. GBBB08 TaxID=2604140 RepID=UPI0027E318C0|nr:LOG family protein [Geminocystis sp. GBBB08]MBL1208336.1 LOG family protein [Geminocystis sp. GBBB08]
MSLLTPSDKTYLYQPKNLQRLLNKLPDYENNKWLKRSLKILAKIVKKNQVDSLEWKILTATLKDLEKGFRVFSDYRQCRKITIFGSARTPVDTLEYKLAKDFAQKVTELGFMVLTGAGGGIMAAGNQGATSKKSFGLNIKLPFEQNANSFIKNDPKLISFKYFFTRKLFFLKESDAIVLFPGGFGTQDEAFETITLCQTGRQPPIPLILIDKPEGNYWKSWHNYICDHLLENGYIQPEDTQIYTITDNVESACKAIQEFYRVYHSCRYLKDLFVMRLNYDLTPLEIEQLNEKFSDILIKGKIEKLPTPQKQKAETDYLPGISFYLQSRKFSRLYSMINVINTFPCQDSPYCQPQYR